MCSRARVAEAYVYGGEQSHSQRTVCFQLELKQTFSQTANFITGGFSAFVVAIGTTEVFVDPFN